MSLINLEHQIKEKINILGKTILDKQYKIRQDRVDNINMFPGEIREYETNPLSILLLCEDLEKNGFVNISVQDMIILLFFLNDCKNIFSIEGEKLVKNICIYDKETLQKQVEQINEIKKNINEIYYKKWIDVYTDPELKLFYYKLYFYTYYIFLTQLSILRINGDITNYVPNIFL